MFKKLLSATILSLTLFCFSFSVIFADCGALGTVNKCGDPGGCTSPTAVCVREGLVGFYTYRCDESPSCENADSTETYCGSLSTNLECGPSNGCKTGYMCTNQNGDNARCVTPTEEGINNDPDNCNLQPDPEPEDPDVEVFGCGEVVTDPNRTDVACQCPNGTSKAFVGFGTENASNQRCCGYVIDGSCRATVPDPNNPNQPDPDDPDDPDDPENGEGGDNDEPELDIFDGPTSANFNQLNPLRMFGGHATQLSSPGGIVSRILLFAFPLAGLILFVMIVWGGFEMITGATSKGIEAGRQRVTAAVVGFTLLFVAYWIFQIVEVIFGVAIL